MAVVAVVGFLVLPITSSAKVRAAVRSQHKVTHRHTSRRKHIRKRSIVRLRKTARRRIVAPHRTALPHLSPAASAVATSHAAAPAATPETPSVASAAAPVALTVAPARLLGFNSWVDAGNISRQTELGAPVRRMFAYWSSVEPAPGEWQWQQLDAQYAQVIGAHLKPLIVVDDSPCWARNPVCTTEQFQGPPAPSNDAEWTKFVSQVAQRYPAAVAIEVWNEPNLAQSFAPQIDPARYTQLLSEAYHAVKQAAPGTPVISAGLAGFQGDFANGSVWSTAAFLRGVMSAGGGSVMDGIGLHVYPMTGAYGSQTWDPRAMQLELSDVRTVRAAAGSSAPLWITELGESTDTGSGFPPGVSPTQQASDLSSMVQALQSQSDVSAVMLDTVDDAPSGYGFGMEQGLGVFAADGTPKPAACAISSLFGGTLHC